jgi:4-hydroxy-3-methylbut-2-enyl diphosphate reductase
MQTLRRKRAKIIDATCPMVKLIHKKIRRLEKDGYFPVIIGQEGHDEVKGIAGQVERSLIVKSPEDISADRLSGIDRLGIVVQSTFVHEEAQAVVDRLREMVPEVKFEDTICRPTSERQDEVRRMAEEFDCLVIVGSRTSANTRHLFKLASGRKACVYLVDHPDQVDKLDIPQDSTVFVTSGASTPMYLVEQVISHLYTLREFQR